MSTEPAAEPKKPKRLGRRSDPPKGLNEVEAAASLMENRFEQRGQAPAEPEVEEPTPPVATAAEPAPAPPKPPRAPRKDADGMARRTYYLTETDADEFEAAVERISEALKGRVPKHRIIGALLAPGLADVDGRINLLREELIAELTA